MFAVKRFGEDNEAASQGDEQPEARRTVQALLQRARKRGAVQSSSSSSSLEVKAKAKQRKNKAVRVGEIDGSRQDARSKSGEAKKRKYEEMIERNRAATSLIDEAAPSLKETLRQLQAAPEHNEDEDEGKQAKQEKKQVIPRKRARRDSYIQDGVKVTIEDDAKRWELSPVIVKNLRHGQLGVQSFFTIQRKAIPVILSTNFDVCIAAPTGSGKTLVFAVPVVQDLLKRIVVRLRALVVLPTRDLVMQVKSVFDAICENTGLQVFGLGNRIRMEKEQQMLVCSKTGASKVDILVTTPGRLIDHIKNTKYFTLEHLRYLVVDEADRLLTQSYQDWLNNVYNAAFRETPGTIQQLGQQLLVKHVSMRKRTGTSLKSHRADEPGLRRILCSATLTQNPQKLAALALNRPIFVSATAVEDFDSWRDKIAEETLNEFRFTLPETLENYMILGTRRNKPVVLFDLLLQLKGQSTLVFTGSVEATHRLAALLERMAKNRGENSNMGIAVLSSSEKTERSETLQRFRNREFSTLVCSDVLARGIDIEDLQNVVHYDVPVYLKTLVHRAGRTARAGRKGCCYALVRRDQGRHYRGLLNQLGIKPKVIKIESKVLEAYETIYRQSLEEMKQNLSGRSDRKA